jgi:large subunit ribosomal protein L31
MKEGIHPQYNPVIFVDSTTGAEFFSYSTMSSRETREVDGVKYFVVNLEVTADSHPFWTGKMHRIDTAGRIERFNSKFAQNLSTGVRKSRKEVTRKAED